MKLSKKIAVVMGGTKQTYDEKIIATAPIAYWPLTELAGTDALNYGSIGGADHLTGKGTYSGVTLAQIAAPGGGLAPLWDGSNDICNIYSIALNAAFTGQLCSLAVWWKVAADAWTDGVARIPMRISADTNNYMQPWKLSTNNTIKYLYKAGGTSETVETTSYATTAWHMAAITATLAGDAMIAYMDGAQVGTTQTSLGTFAGALSATLCVLGSAGTTPANVWAGYISRAMVWSKVITPAQILALYNGGL